MLGQMAGHVTDHPVALSLAHEEARAAHAAASRKTNCYGREQAAVLPGSTAWRELSGAALRLARGDRRIEPASPRVVNEVQKGP
jgi:hypothetical protein